MVNLFRRYQQPLLIVLTVFTIISFVVLYNLPNTRSGNYHTDTVGQIYGRPVASNEVQRASRRFEVVRDLMLMDLQPLMGNARTMNEAQDNFIWNSIILRHEAQELGVMSVEPSSSEHSVLDSLVADRIKAMPVFQTNNAFDYSRYSQFVQNGLGPRGFSSRELEEVVADQIRLEKVKEVVGSSAVATTAEIRETYTEMNQKVEVSVVRLKLEDFKAAVQVSDDDVKKLFEERKATLKSPEKRKVKYVSFLVPKTDKPLVGKERVAAMQKLADQAQEFAQKMTAQGADFNAVATAAGVKPEESPAFEAGLPPPEFGVSPQVAAAAFRLTKAEPNSDALSGNQGYYVLQLSHIEESRPLTLEEAKPQLTEQLKQERAQEAMGLKANELRTKIEAELKAGKSFADAATAAGTKADKLAPFSSQDRLKDDADGPTIMGRAMDLTDGQLSDFTPTQTGGLLIHLEKRQPIDEAAFAKEKATLTTRLQEAKREMLFRDWLRIRSKAANLQLYRG